MADNQQLQPPLPDFAASAHAMRVLADQYQRFADNPATLTPDGALLLQEIRNLRGEMQESRNLRGEMRGEMRNLREEMRGEMRTLRGEMNRRFDQLEQRATADRINMNAKLENRFLRDNDTLAPLRSYRDNTEIPNFPATVEDITQLASDVLNGILDALGEATTGGINQRRRRLNRAVGRP